MDLRDEAIHRAASPPDMERVRELFREYADGLKVDPCFQGFERELAALPGNYAPPHYANPLPGVICLGLDLASAA